MCVCESLSCARLFATAWTVAHQAPLSMRFSRQGYWTGLPFPSPGDFPNPGIELRSPALHADSLPTELQGKPHSNTMSVVKYKTKGKAADLLRERTMMQIAFMNELRQESSLNHSIHFAFAGDSVWLYIITEGYAGICIFNTLDGIFKSILNLIFKTGLFI